MARLISKTTPRGLSDSAAASRIKVKYGRTPFSACRLTDDSFGRVRPTQALVQEVKTLQAEGVAGPATFSCAVAILLKNGSVPDAEALVQEYSSSFSSAVPIEVTASFMHYHSRRRDVQMVHRLWERVRRDDKNWHLNVRLHEILMYAFVRAGLYAKARELFDLAVLFVHPTSSMYGALVLAQDSVVLGRGVATQYAKEMRGDAETVLLQLCKRCGDAGAAQELFDGMDVRLHTPARWAFLLCSHRNLPGAEAVLKSMVAAGISPLPSCFTHCISLSSLSQAERFFATALRYGVANRQLGAVLLRRYIADEEYEKAQTLLAKYTVLRGVKEEHLLTQIMHKKRA